MQIPLEETRSMHDSDLKKLDNPLAQQVMQGRTHAANVIRLCLARMYQHPDAATFDQWAVVPCLTDQGTIGVVDIAAGTAWDSGEEAPETVHDLGLSESDEVYAGANTTGGTVTIDGEVVEYDATAVIDGKVIRPTIPPGWRQIALPTWRGYEGGDGHHRVPVGVFSADPIEPRLVCYGLRTCYGTPGRPRRYLAWRDERRYPGDIVKSYRWLSSPNIEDNNPGWWPLTDDQREWCGQLMHAWFDDVDSRLESRLDDNEKSINPSNHPAQSLGIFSWTDSTAEERQVRSLNEHRCRIADDATQSVLKKINAYWLSGMDIRKCNDDGNWEWDRHWDFNQGVIGARRADGLHAKLSVIVAERLKPVCESLWWMVSFPDPVRTYKFGPNQDQYEAALKSAAESISMTLLEGRKPVSEVIDKMAEIHLANGPVAVPENYQLYIQ